MYKYIRHVLHIMQGNNLKVQNSTSFLFEKIFVQLNSIDILHLVSSARVLIYSLNYHMKPDKLRGI